MGLVGRSNHTPSGVGDSPTAAEPWTRRVKKITIGSKLLRKLGPSRMTEEDQLSVLIDRAYDILLGREPDEAAYGFWIQKFKSGMNRDQFLHYLLTSEEFLKNKPKWYDPGLWERCAELGIEAIIPLKSGGRLIGPTWDDSVLVGIINQCGEWEPHITKLLSDYLRPGDVFVDAGANIGYFSIIASLSVGETGRVISFEPSPLNRRYCQMNIELNQLTNVTIYENGLWDKPTTLKIDTQKKNMGGAHISNTGIDIECIPMDSLHIAPNIIKMDIEGAEPFALRGMENTLRKFKPTLILEINRYCLRNFFGIDADSIWDLLSSFGYKLSMIALSELTEIDSLQHLYELCPDNGLIDVLAAPRRPVNEIDREASAT